MRFSYILAAFLQTFLLVQFSNGQSRKIDSLQQLIKVAKEDTNKVFLLNSLSNEFNTSSPEKALEFAQMALKVAEKIDDKSGMAVAYAKLGVANYYLGNFNSSIENYIKCIKISEQKGLIELMAKCYGNMASVYDVQGDDEKALQNYLKQLFYSEKIDKKSQIVTANHNIGGLYIRKKQYDKAEEFYHKSLNVAIQSKNKSSIAMSYHSIAILMSIQGNPTKALPYFLKALAMMEQVPGSEHDVANMCDDIGNAYIMVANFKEAEIYLKRAEIYFRNTKNRLGIKNIYNSFYQLYGVKKDWEKALEYHINFSLMKDTLFSEESVKQTTEMNARFETEKKDKELLKKDVEIQKREADVKEKSWQMKAFFGAFILILVVAIFIYRGFRQKQGANKLLEEKNELIEEQKKLVLEKNKDITDSINYAQKIQRSILPPDGLVKKLLPGCFIYYKPKDVVSGDFYWLEEKEDEIMFAAVDCTGHGVPGAMMSVIGFNLLSQAVNEKAITVPALILEHLDRGVTDTLRQSSGTDSVKDGMDLSLCTLNVKNNILQYAGAFNNLWVVRKNLTESYLPKNEREQLFENDLLEIKGDKFPIGSNVDGIGDTYNNNEFKLQKDDCIYLYSDGFADQFGGPKGKKFKYNSLKKLLISISHLSPEEQKQNIDRRFEDWKGHLEQVDDILIIGVKIG